MRSRSRAFTVIELLVVITIILILIGLLLPAVAAAYRSAMEYECQNNLHQLAIVVATYCADNDGYFPRATGLKVLPSANDWLYVGKANPQAIANGILVAAGRIGKTDLYYCPIDVDSGLLRSKQPPSYVGFNFKPPKCQMSYVINGSITYGDTLFGTGKNQERRVRRFSEFDPNDFLFIEESEDSPFDQAFMNPNSTGNYTITKRHHGGGYVAYMDGSVQWWSQEDFNLEAARVYTGSDDWYKNATDGSNTPNHWNPG